MAKNSNQKPKGRKKATKPLPSDLALLTDDDRQKFTLALEIDPNQKSNRFGKEFMAAQSVCIRPASADEPPVVYNLKELLVEHVRKLCSNLGITNCGSQNNFNCRKAIATYFRYEDALDATGMKPRSHASMLTNTVCRAINVVFSDEFIEDFKTANDRKTRKDHETKNTNKAFWIQAAMAYNSCLACDVVSVAATGDPIAPRETGTAAFATPFAATKNITMVADEHFEDESPPPTSNDSFSTLVFPPDDIYLCDLVEDPELNLSCVLQFDTEAFRMKILDLFKICRKMKENMTVSGTHDSDPWNFVECAMTGMTKGFTKIAVYYFYQRCETDKDIDSCFQPFLDIAIRGDTVSLLDDDDVDIVDASLSSSKKLTAQQERERADSAMIQNVFAQGNAILKRLADSAEQSKVMASNLKKKTKFHARLEVAKALGDREELVKLMDEARAMDNSDSEQD